MKACAPCKWLLAAALVLPLKADIVCALGSEAASYKPAADQRPTSDALELAGRVNAAVKTICGAQCPTMALFRNATAPNAMLIADAGQAKLVYAPRFFAAVYDSSGDGGIVYRGRDLERLLSGRHARAQKECQRESQELSSLCHSAPP